MADMVLSPGMDWEERELKVSIEVINALINLIMVYIIKIHASLLPYLLF
jgi:hypothetical protein